METNFFIALSFLFLGFIIGAGLTAYFFYRKFLSHPEEEHINHNEKSENPEFITLTPISEEEIKNGDNPFKKIIEAVRNNLQGKPIFSEKKAFEKALNEKWKEAHNEEDYESCQYYKDTLESLDQWFDIRKKWFISCVGKKLKPNKLNCDCPNCQEFLESGKLVTSEEMAMYMFSDENNKKLNKENTFMFSICE